LRSNYRSPEPGRFHPKNQGIRVQFKVAPPQHFLYSFPEGQGQTPMIWAGKTSLSITSTAGLEERVGKRRHEDPIFAIFRQVGQSQGESPSVDLQDKT
jgi:hypothetical protein